MAFILGGWRSGAMAQVDVQPLSGIRVLDLSRILAGPLAAQMLGDLGAEVIKVERPLSGDDARHYGPPFLKDRDGRDTRESPMYLSANRNKKSITVDLSKPEGQALIRRLAGVSDVMIENYKAGDLARYGLDYESLGKENPRLIYCSVTGFGQSGPYRHRAGYDPIFQAMCGLMSVTGEPDDAPGGGPMKVGPSIVDVITGLFASNAIQAALYARDAQGGNGQYIDLALLDCGIAAMSHHAMQYLISGVPPARRGTAGNGGATSGRFRCLDGDIMLSPGNDEQFRRLVTVLGSPQLAVDPRFLSNPLRVRHRDDITALVTARVGAWRAGALAAALAEESVPAATINDLAQVFDDPQVRHREMAVSGAHALAGVLPMIANPIRFSDTPIARYDGPPVLGEHTDHILSAVLGFDEAGIAALRQAGAV